jgi:hypothetical protein
MLCQELVTMETVPLVKLKGVEHPHWQVLLVPRRLVSLPSQA